MNVGNVGICCKLEMIYEFDFLNVRKKVIKEYNDMLGLKWCNVKKIYKMLIIGYLYGYFDGKCGGVIKWYWYLVEFVF